MDADSVWLSVRCAFCAGAPEGRVRESEVVFSADAPATAARGHLAGFALAVRDAAARGDTAALRPVMAPEFTFSLIGRQGASQAFAAWGSDGMRPVLEIPALLDRGFATGDSLLWTAPPEFRDAPNYQGPRLGFRRSTSGAWQWMFLR
jgi:hypothetical protein